MSNNPLFSIVVPTRNRANLLPAALQTALNQSFDDYEIIVSDNYSSTETAEVVGSFSDPRLRYVRSDRMLTMPDSWEFALNHARGEFITILCDDDALSPTLLERLNAHLAEESTNVLTWLRYSYYAEDWYVKSQRNVLMLAPVSGEREIRSSELMLRQWFDGCTYYGHAPMIFNSCCHRSIIDRIRTRAGRVFLGSAPDVASSLALLSVTDNYTFVDDVFSLAGGTRQSIGSNCMYGGAGAFQEYVAEFEADVYPRGPFKGTTLTTAVADTLITVREALARDLVDYTINWRNYFLGCYRDLLTYERAGTDISRWRYLFWAALYRQPASLQQEFLHDVMAQERASAINISKDRLALWKLALKQPLSIKRQFLRFAAGSRRRQARSKLKLLRANDTLPPSSPSPYLIFGKDGGFTNIVECARKLDSFVDNIKRGKLPLAPSEESVLAAQV